MPAGMVARNNHRRPCNNHKQAILKQQKHEKRAMTRLEDGGSELLEGGVIDLELGLGDLDEHFIVLATGELALVLGALARAATVVENGDLWARATLWVPASAVRRTARRRRTQASAPS